MAFLSAVLTALLEVIVIAGVMLAGIKVGSTLRKKKDAKKAMEEGADK